MTKENVVKILVIGHKGQLGTDMCNVMKDAKHEVEGIDFPDIDITSFDSVASVVSLSKPNVIVNCAAFTAVNDCETKQELAYAVNADGAGNIGRAAASIRAKVLHISTDYVFSGVAASPLVETDPCEPQSVYGKSKLAGEIALAKELKEHFIFRIAWLYGANGNNFVKTICRVGRERSVDGKALRVVDDQFGTPTWTVDVCRQALQVIGTSHYGIYHCTSQGECSWLEFATRILQQFGIRAKIEPCTTNEYPQPAPRPAYSVLDNAKLRSLALDVMPDWEESFDHFAAQIKASGVWN